MKNNTENILEISKKFTLEINLEIREYFYTRNNSALIAFTIGMEFNLNKTCFKIAGGHTDSPNLRFASNNYTTSAKLEKVII
jgi:aspartyl aminopeptidase